MSTFQSNDNLFESCAWYFKHGMRDVTLISQLKPVGLEKDLVWSYLAVFFNSQELIVGGSAGLG